MDHVSAARRCRWAGLCVLLTTGASLIVAVWWLRTAALSQMGGTVRFDASGVHTLAELEQMIEATQTHVVVHRNHKDRRLFVARGSYGVDELLGAIRAATKLGARTVGTTIYLTPLPHRSGRPGHYPWLPKGLNARMGELLRPHASSVNLQSEGVPFATEDFAGGRTVPFAGLSETQQAFVRRRFARHPRDPEFWPIAPPPPAILPESEVTKGLDSKDLGFGTTFQMIVATYLPAKDEGSPLHFTWMETVPLYDSGRARLNIVLPDE